MYHPLHISVILLSDIIKVRDLMAEGLRWEIGGRVTTDEAWVLGEQIFIGQTVLKRTHWLVDCAGKRLVTDPGQPEYPIFRV